MCPSRGVDSMAGDDIVETALKKAATRAARVAALDAAGMPQVDGDVDDGPAKTKPERTVGQSGWGLFFVCCSVGCCRIFM